jgi:MFS family permease
VTGAYGRILRLRGAKQLMLAATATWVGNTMTPVAFLLFARTATGSYSGAGLVVGALTAGSALLAPLLGRLIDRRGADRAVLELALPGAVTDVALILAGRAHAAAAALVAIAFVSGATVAPVGSGTRVVWSATIADAGDRQSAYGLLTALGEVSFLLGPLVAGLAAAVSLTFAVALSGVLALLGAVLFAATPGARAHGRTVATATAGAGSVLASPGLRIVVATSALWGVNFGGLDVAFPVIARQDGTTAAAGVLLSALAVGLGTTGLAYGRRRAGRTAAARYAPLTLLATAGLLPLLALPPLPALVVLALLAGACFAPITLTQNAAVDEVSPSRGAAEAFALVGSAYGAGVAAGAAVAGTLVDGPGPRAAIALGCCAMLIATGVAALGFRS